MGPAAGRGTVVEAVRSRGSEPARGWLQGRFRDGVLSGLRTGRGIPAGAPPPV